MTHNANLSSDNILSIALVSEYPDLYIKSFSHEQRQEIVHKALLCVRVLDQLSDTLNGAAVIAIVDSLLPKTPEQWIAMVQKTRESVKKEVAALIRDTQNLVLLIGSHNNEIEKDECTMRLCRNHAIIQKYLTHYGALFELIGLKLPATYPAKFLHPHTPQAAH